MKGSIAASPSPTYSTYGTAYVPTYVWYCVRQRTSLYWRSHLILGPLLILGPHHVFLLLLLLLSMLRLCLVRFRCYFCLVWWGFVEYFCVSPPQFIPPPPSAPGPAAAGGGAPGTGKRSGPADCPRTHVGPHGGRGPQAPGRAYI